MSRLFEAEMDAGGAYNPRTVEEVFRDFKGRRAGMIKALTTGKKIVFFFFFFNHFLTGKLNFVITLLCADVQEFFRLCDPGEC